MTNAKTAAARRERTAINLPMVSKTELLEAIESGVRDAIRAAIGGPIFHEEIYGAITDGVRKAHEGGRVRR